MQTLSDNNITVSLFKAGGITTACPKIYYLSDNSPSRVTYTGIAYPSLRFGHCPIMDYSIPDRIRRQPLPKNAFRRNSGAVLSHYLWLPCQQAQSSALYLHRQQYELLQVHLRTKRDSATSIYQRHVKAKIKSVVCVSYSILTFKVLSRINYSFTYFTKPFFVSIAVPNFDYILYIRNLYWN